MKLDPEHIGRNPAERLHVIFSAARPHSVKTPAMDVWARVFEFEEERDLLKKARLVINAVHYLQDELAAAELAIERDGRWPTEDYAEELGRRRCA